MIRDFQLGEKDTSPAKKEFKNFNTQDYATSDPWPRIPVMFQLEARSMDEGRIIHVKLPTDLVGHRLSIGGAAYNRFFKIEASGPAGFLVERGVDTDGSGLGAKLMLDSSLFLGSFSNGGKWSKWSSSRKGGHIPIGTLIDYLSDGYIPKDTRTNGRAPTGITPVIVNTVKVVEDEMKGYKKMLEEINQGAKKHGLTLFIKEDGSVGARMEF